MRRFFWRAWSRARCTSAAFTMPHSTRISPSFFCCFAMVRIPCSAADARPRHAWRAGEIVNGLAFGHPASPQVPGPCFACSTTEGGAGQSAPLIACRSAMSGPLNYTPIRPPKFVRPHGVPCETASPRSSPPGADADRCGQSTRGGKGFSRFFPQRGSDSPRKATMASCQGAGCAAPPRRGSTSACEEGSATAARFPNRRGAGRAWKPVLRRAPRRAVPRWARRGFSRRGC